MAEADVKTKRMLRAAIRRLAGALARAHAGAALLAAMVALAIGTSHAASPPPMQPPPIPAAMLEALRVGGVNLLFDWYDTDKFRPRAFDNELPLIKAAGGGHVRLIISMDILEDGISGTLRDDRWRHLKAFVTKAKAAGLVTIIDVHNTGLRGPDGKWTEDFMRGIAEPAVRRRHLQALQRPLTYNAFTSAFSRTHAERERLQAARDTFLACLLEYFASNPLAVAAGATQGWLPPAVHQAWSTLAPDEQQFFLKNS